MLVALRVPPVTVSESPSPVFAWNPEFCGISTWSSCSFDGGADPSESIVLHGHQESKQKGDEVNHDLWRKRLSPFLEAPESLFEGQGKPKLLDKTISRGKQSHAKLVQATTCEEAMGLPAPMTPPSRRSKPWHFPRSNCFQAMREQARADG